MIRKAAAALPAVLLLAACSSLPPATPGAHQARHAGNTSAKRVPVLHAGKAVTFTDLQYGQPPERQAWKLTSVHSVSYAAAMQGGVDSDVPAQLGASDPQHGYRYLVLGLTITDEGPSGFGQAVQPTVDNASFEWARPGGQAGSTTADCDSSPPLPGQSPVTVPYVSSLCATQDLAPGQSASGYAWFPVPDKPVDIEVAEPDPAAPLLIIDPSGLIRSAWCATANPC